LLLPNRRSPRVLVPTGLPSAASMLARHSRSRYQRLGQAVLRRGVSTGLLSMLPVWRIVPHTDDTGADSIQGYVRAHLPATASVGALLGPPRANAKPVLRIFDGTGQTLAVGKVGHNSLASALVRHEHRVLQDLQHAGFQHLEPPTVLHFGTWRGLDVLLLSALGSAGRAAPSWKLPLAAMHELAEHADVTSETVGASSYLRDLRQRSALLPATSQVHDHLDIVAKRTSSVQLSFGRWHGDWAPWNMGASSDPVPLWDWERSQVDVPLGFDAVHFILQEEFKNRATASAAVAGVCGRSAAALNRWYPDRERVDATILLYLCEILARYVVDGGPHPSAALQNRITTILTMLSLITDNTAEESHADA
jgi:hypothetical protein